MPKYRSTQLDPAFRALADPTRRSIIELLGRNRATTSQLASHFDMALPSFTQHLRVLEDGGFVTSVKTGRVRTYELEVEQLQACGGWLATQQALWQTRFDQLDGFVRTMYSGKKTTSEKHS